MIVSVISTASTAAHNSSRGIVVEYTTMSIRFDYVTFAVLAMFTLLLSPFTVLHDTSDPRMGDPSSAV